MQVFREALQLTILGALEKCQPCLRGTMPVMLLRFSSSTVYLSKLSHLVKCFQSLTRRQTLYVRSLIVYHKLM